MSPNPVHHPQIHTHPAADSHSTNTPEPITPPPSSPTSQPGPPNAHRPNQRLDADGPKSLAWRNTVSKTDWHPIKKPAPLVLAPFTHLSLPRPQIRRPPPEPVTPPLERQRQQQPFRFLDLPFDIRALVYQYALGHQHIHLHRSRGARRHRERGRDRHPSTPLTHRVCKNYRPSSSSSSSSSSLAESSCGGKCLAGGKYPERRERLDLGLLRSCGRVYAEAWAVPYSHNTFSANGRTVPAFVAAVGLEACARVRGLRVTGFVDNKLESRGFRNGCTAVADYFTGLEELGVSVDLGEGLSGRSEILESGMGRRGRAWLVGVLRLGVLGEGLRDLEVEFRKVEVEGGSRVETEELEGLEREVKMVLMPKSDD